MMTLTQAGRAVTILFKRSHVAPLLADANDWEKREVGTLLQREPVEVPRRRKREVLSCLRGD